jgi:hypothetical protein
MAKHAVFLNMTLPLLNGTMTVQRWIVGEAASGKRGICRISLSNAVKKLLRMVMTSSNEW